MQDKVSNELFGKFAEANPVAVKESHWQKGALKEKEDLGSGNPQLPVMRVTAEEAHRFARWIGGYLPTTAQFDRAAGAGLELPEVNPLKKAAWDALNFQQKCQLGVRFGHDGFKQWHQLSDDDKKAVGVNRFVEGPMPLNEATIDVGPYGCRHLAGNGREYTNSIYLTTKLISSASDKDLSKADVELRGKSYRSHVPSFWQFGPDLDFVDFRARPDVTFDIGFRVVVHPGR
jgi:formylglycine-generating enzyme required for sulfatase activity